MLYGFEWPIVVPGRALLFLLLYRKAKLLFPFPVFSAKIEIQVCI